jgi:hypothetical protein
MNKSWKNALWLLLPLVLPLLWLAARTDEQRIQAWADKRKLGPIAIDDRPVGATPFNGKVKVDTKVYYAVTTNGTELWVAVTRPVAAIQRTRTGEYKSIE